MPDVIDRIATADRPWALWLLQARLGQLPPPEDEDWLVWLLLAGRGYGKGKSASNWLGRKVVKAPPDSEWVVLAPTYDLVRRVCVEGPSGLLTALGAEAHGSYGPLVESWNRSMGELRLTNGAMIFALSADKPDRLRGLNLSGGWVDELCSMDYAEQLWTEALIPALRVGRPRLAVSTTPRPTALLRDLVGRKDGSVRVSRGSTWENAENLPVEFLAELRARYEGTRIGRQELEAEILEDIEGALWHREWIHHVAEAPHLDRVVVSVDPATTAHEGSDETGIITAGRAGVGQTSHGYVIDDRSGVLTPDGWGRRACESYIDHHADAVVYESNQGGDMVAHVIRSAWAGLVADGRASGPTPRLVSVRASRGKQARAEPVAAQYEQGRWHHVGSWPALEDQQCSWVPGSGESPDRVDAVVWAATELTVTSLSSVVASGTKQLRAALPSTRGAAAVRRR